MSLPCSSHRICAASTAKGMAAVTSVIIPRANGINLCSRGGRSGDCNNSCHANRVERMAARLCLNRVINSRLLTIAV
jgi:hypothetical protein